MAQTRRVAAALIVAGLWAFPGAAQTWGVGAAAGARPALSVTMTPDRSATYHLTSHLSDERVVVTTDVQRSMIPSFGYGVGWRLRFYAGVGAEGASERGGEGRETFALRIPLGTQCDVAPAALAVFAEASPTLGPLPTTRLGARASAGLRAVF